MGQVGYYVLFLIRWLLDGKGVFSEKTEIIKKKVYFATYNASDQDCHDNNALFSSLGIKVSNFIT